MTLAEREARSRFRRGWRRNGIRRPAFAEALALRVTLRSWASVPLRASCTTTGALVKGRRTFHLTHGWVGRHPLDVPVFVVTHQASPEWVSEGSPFSFVRDGLESAVAQAKAAAGDKDVGVIGANLVQQCIKAGLLDEIHLDMVPVVLGGGVGLFDHLGTGPIELESTRVIEGAGVTHLTFRVV